MVAAIRFKVTIRNSRIIRICKRVWIRICKGVGTKMGQRVEYRAWSWDEHSQAGVIDAAVRVIMDGAVNV